MKKALPQSSLNLTNVDAAEGVPIPEEMPPDLLQKHSSNVEGIGEPITARFLTQTTTDPSNWYPSLLLSFAFFIDWLFTHNMHRWMFEKYDGVRGFWNPIKRLFYSRQGKAFEIPKEIVNTMPADFFMDGEIW